MTAEARHVFTPVLRFCFAAGDGSACPLSQITRQTSTWRSSRLRPADAKTSTMETKFFPKPRLASSSSNSHGYLLSCVSRGART